MLVFRNPGLIELDAVRTMGVSVKNPGSFGRFGTGIKFGIATVLRGGGEMVIIRGAKAHKVATLPKEIRGEMFDLVTLDDEPMGITTQLGKDWQPWMVLREFGCNARDEGGTFHDGEGFSGDDCGEDETVIVVDWDELDAAYRDRGNLFLEGEALVETEKLRILPGQSEFLFYRGVRVFKLPKPSTYTYDLLETLYLTEDRTLSGTWQVDPIIRDALYTLDNKEILDAVLACGDGRYEASLDFEAHGWGLKASRAFIDSGIEAREARRPLSASARKVVMKHVREAQGEEQSYSGGGTYRRQVNDAFGYALAQLDEVGIKFADDQQFVRVEELPAEGQMSMVENGRVYLHADLMAKGARDIAAELIVRWVDLNITGYGMDDAVRLLAPILINCCPDFQRDEQLLREDEAIADEEPAAEPEAVEEVA